MKMKKVAKESLEEVQKYLELDYEPIDAWVEDFEELVDERKEIESLKIEWSDGNQIHSIEANQNLDEPINIWIYEEKEMKTFYERFHESKYAENPDNCIAFYLGVLCTIISYRNHQFYVDKFIKGGLTRFHKFEDMKKLYLEVSRYFGEIEDDTKSAIYREKVSDYFMKTGGEKFDGDTVSFMFATSFGYGNPLESVLTFSEAQEKWELGKSTLRKTYRDERFKEGEIRKSGGTWLVTYEAMKRLYGEPTKVAYKNIHTKETLTEKEYLKIIERELDDYRDDFDENLSDEEIKELLIERDTDFKRIEE